MIEDYNFAGDRELVINWAEGSQIASITASTRKYIGKIKKIHEEYKSETVLVENVDGSVYMTFPCDWIKLPKPKRTMSDENKAKAAERMKNARAKKG